MKTTRVAALAACVLAVPAWSRAADDTIKKTGETPIKCSISSISKDEVKYEKGGKEETVPTFEIESIRLADEPAQLNLIRNQANNGAYENALKALDRLDVDSIEKAEVKGEVQYLRAYCTARLALGGSGDVGAAGRQVKEFIDANSNSYHYYPANELAGDLLVALGRYDAATNFYKALSTAPAAAWKIKAGIDTGRAKLAEKKYEPALKEFETALGLTDQDKSPESQKLAAMLGKAACLAQTGKPDEGIKLAETVISKLPAEEVDLHAWAYVVLGNCYRQLPNHTKQALLAFLHVDVLYFSNPQWHAEALWNLASLWQELKKIDRATQASAMLKERYPNSTWAKL
ncbi:MAG TPA: tetratricopeptide repeat protein [Pirellulales bacterium]|nr:tetratricopeptide repeat protein [Pirellulales bacterium]